MTGPVITGWSAVSPFGIGRGAFERGLRSGRRVESAPPVAWAVPDDRACLVPSFNPREVLGRAGTRSMDRVSGLAVTAVQELLTDLGRDSVPTDGAGLVLGSTTGSAQSMMDFSRDSFVQAKPHFVDAARFPNAVMNCAAGQCAIWHQLRGPNATVAGGRLAGLYALNYALRLLAAGRADVVLCGGVEEYSPARSWLEYHSRGDDERDAVLGEGCGVLLLEPNVETRRGLAEVLGIEFGVVLGLDYRDSLRSCLLRALRRAGVAPGDVWALVPCGPPGDAGEQERHVIEEVFDGCSAYPLAAVPVFGDASAALAVFQVMLVLSRAPKVEAGDERIALVTSVDRAGVVGCAVLRLL